MDDIELKIAFKEANETESFKVHNDFLNSLLLDSSEKGIEKHYTLFQESSNSNLKRILGKGFLKRKDYGFEFLIKKLKTETDLVKKSNVIHILGLSGNKKAITEIIPLLDSTSDDIRYKSIVSIGWLGDTSVIKVLENHYFKEKSDILRGFTVSAMRQIFFRDKTSKEQILSFIYSNLKAETNLKVIAIMIVVMQDLNKNKYGLKEDPNTGKISGNVQETKEKIIEKLNL